MNRNTGNFQGASFIGIVLSFRQVMNASQLITDTDESVNASQKQTNDEDVNWTFERTRGLHWKQV